MGKVAVHNIVVKIAQVPIGINGDAGAYGPSENGIWDIADPIVNCAAVPAVLDIQNTGGAYDTLVRHIPVAIARPVFVPFFTSGHDLLIAPGKSIDVSALVFVVLPLDLVLGIDLGKDGE
jgi:hypothetical protein